MADISIEEADAEQKQSYKEYQEFTKGDNPEVKWETFLDKLVAAGAKEEDKDKASIIRQLKT